MKPSQQPVNWQALTFLAILACLLTLGQHRAQNQGAVSLPERIIVAAGRPVQGALSRIGAWPRNLFVGLTQGPKLWAENERLREERDQAKAQVTELIQYYLDYKKLRSDLGMSPQYAADKVPAKVIGLLFGPRRCRATLKLEQTGAVNEDDIVIQASGLVGRIIRVQGDTAEVMLLLDSQAAVAARDSRSRDQGMVYPEWSLSMHATKLKMAKLKAVADLREGDLIVTTGLDGVYPANLPLGRIERVVYSAARPEAVTAVVRPAVDFFRLEYVWVLRQK